MQTDPISHGDISYNAAEQQFEAIVVLHDANGARSYACTLPAPLTLPLADAEAQLRRTALIRHRTAPGLFCAPLQMTPPAHWGSTRPSWHSHLRAALPKLFAFRAA